MDFKPYIEDSISLSMALYSCFCLYKYKQTNNIEWFRYIWYVFFVYLIYDLYTCDKIDFRIHHISSLCLTVISLCFPSIPFAIVEPMFTALMVETSSIFLNVKSIIRTYLKQPTTNLSSSFSKILKKIQPINDILFLLLFTYTRIYLFNKDVVFNPDVYTNLAKTANFWLVDKLSILSFWSLSLLNMYWFSLISKKAINTAFGYDVFEYRPNKNDAFYLEIEKIQNSLALK